MIREATDRDLSTLSNFAVELFGDTLEVQTDEIKILLQSEDAHFFIYFDHDIPIGFAQVQLRYDYVEGTSSSPVGYLEGIFIEKAYRKKGYAKALLSACEAWAKGKGCTEFASVVVSRVLRLLDKIYLEITKCVKSQELRERMFAEVRSVAFADSHIFNPYVSSHWRDLEVEGDSALYRRKASS